MKVNICVISKNEDPYIKDWYDWYVNKVGVDRIYYFDNNEDKHLEKMLNSEDYPSLVYTYFPGSAMQKKMLSILL